MTPNGQNAQAVTGNQKAICIGAINVQLKLVLLTYLFRLLFWYGTLARNQLLLVSRISSITWLMQFFTKPSDSCYEDTIFNRYFSA